MQIVNGLTIAVLLVFTSAVEAKPKRKVRVYEPTPSNPTEREVRRLQPIAKAHQDRCSKFRKELAKVVVWPRDVSGIAQLPSKDAYMKLLKTLDAFPGQSRSGTEIMKWVSVRRETDWPIESGVAFDLHKHILSVVVDCASGEYLENMSLLIREANKFDLNETEKSRVKSSVMGVVSRHLDGPARMSNVAFVLSLVFRLEDAGYFADRSDAVTRIREIERENMKLRVELQTRAKAEDLRRAGKSRLVNLTYEAQKSGEMLARLSSVVNELRGPAQAGVAR